MNEAGTAAADIGAPPFDSQVAWVFPGRQGTPAQALARIELLCAGIPDLFALLLAILATHQAVAKDILALSIAQFRPDVADLGKDGLVALLTSILNGGRPGFDAVLRSRRKAERKAVALPWGKA
jgi:hypothetical protein